MIKVRSFCYEGEKYWQKKAPQDINNLQKNQQAILLILIIQAYSQKCPDLFILLITKVSTPLTFRVHVTHFVRYCIYKYIFAKLHKTMDKQQFFLFKFKSN